MDQQQTVTATAIDRMKREAKRLGRATTVRHHTALDMVAQAHGFASWRAVTQAAASAPHPPVGTPAPLSQGGNSTPARAPVAGLGKSERVGERGVRK